MSTRLDRQSIVDACVELLGTDAHASLTLRRLGQHLGVDPTAVYRHFDGKDDLLRAVADRVLEHVVADLPGPRTRWESVVTTICRRLRAALVAHPQVAALVCSGPPRRDHELVLTEVLLAQLARAGLDRRSAARAYHALIELTVGSSILDAELAQRSDEDRTEAYRQWRSTYATLDPARFPASVATSAHLYEGTADERFDHALGLLLAGISRRSRS